MKKHKKKLVENMLNLHVEAHDAIKRAMEKGNPDAAVVMLEQCQNSAIQIGGMIEEELGANFETVVFLESYCEQLYQTYELIRKKQPFNIGKICKNLRRELIRIENSVKNDIPEVITAVFLPYKASMWDSLESVWKAADDDPDCDAYVVPIPYVDRNSDGSFGEIHYEGSQYPKYVPITSWETYDIAAEHPDIIFIHNPYDEFNHVTSVLPEYYSKKLKNCTDMLVYIPYYILQEIDPNDYEAAESVEHFCTVPAVVYADRVIVQSKAWRQIYIDVMTKIMGNDTKQIWGKKILGLGSPKIDKVHTAVRDKLEIPKEWLKIIERPDGKRKKIVFYNTSVSALLQYSEAMLDKMEYVFRVFKENENEIALLWRPHPLIKATIESMRPQLWAKYEKIVKTYIEEGWGIYDDTVDMNRAIALSDAYYGDPSSIVKLYQESNKPIVLQNVEQKGTLGETETIYFFSIALSADKLWFISTTRNFMSINKFTGNTAYTHWIEKRPWERQSALRGAMFEVGRCIYWIGYDKQDLHEYNIENNEYTYWELPELEEIDLKSSIDIIYYDSKLWVCRRTAPYIIIIDLVQKKCEVHSELFEKQNDTYSEQKELQVKCLLQVNRWLYLFQEQNMVVKFNLDNCCGEYIAMPEEVSNAICAVWENDVFYILTSDRTVYLWDKSKDNVEQIYHCEDESQSFGRIEATKHRIFLIPSSSDKILSIDLHEDKVAEQVKYPDDFRYSDYICTERYGKRVEDEKQIWYANYYGNYVLRIDKQSEKIEWIKIVAPSLYDEWYFKKSNGETIPYYMEKAETLGRLMYADCNRELNDLSEKQSSRIGESIWEVLINEE